MCLGYITDITDIAHFPSRYLRSYRAPGVFPSGYFAGSSPPPGGQVQKKKSIIVLHDSLS